MAFNVKPQQVDIQSDQIEAQSPPKSKEVDKQDFEMELAPMISS